MNKRRYQAREFQAVRWSAVEERLRDARRVVFAVDVAKEVFVGALLSEEGETLWLLKWRHPEETRALVAQVVQSVGAGRLEVVMEPSGTYGDALRWQFRGAGVALYRVSPKRVHDAAEVYDGVPSLHDAKAATVIGRLHLANTSAVWEAESEQRRALQAQLRLLGLYQERYLGGVNRLEALLSRHWPEASRWLAVDSVSLLKLLAAYGDATAVAGKTTSAVLVASGGAPQDYPDAASYLKGLGLNLKEHSSGTHRGQLKITKRGPALARRYLYFAALRLIYRAPAVRTWLEAKAQRDGGRKGKGVIAVMRKLAKALWHVGQGECFDAGRLFGPRSGASALAA